MDQRPPAPALPDLDTVLHYRLTVLVVPAPKGEIPALDRWIARNPAAVIVVPLVAAHNDPGVFIGTLEQALDGTVSHATQPALPVQDRIVDLLNALLQTSSHLSLVLRGYDVIRDPAVHAVVSYMLDYLPPHMHFLIVTDVTPPLDALPRLLVRRQAVLLRMPSEAPPVA